MTEQDLIDLGFKKEFGDNFHYYTYDFIPGFSLITQANDEIVNDNWTLEVFESEGKIRYNDKSIVKSLIEIINKGK